MNIWTRISNLIASPPDPVRPPMPGEDWAVGDIVAHRLRPDERMAVSGFEWKGNPSEWTGQIFCRRVLPDGTFEELLFSGGELIREQTT